MGCGFDPDLMIWARASTSEGVVYGMTDITRYDIDSAWRYRFAVEIRLDNSIDCM